MIMESVENLLKSMELSWSEPAVGSRESIPLGNGELGINVWVDAAGVIHILLARGDCWSGNGQLMKAGYVRFTLESGGGRLDRLLEHRLSFYEGTQTVLLGGPAQAAVTLWVDADAPLLHLEARSEDPLALRCEAVLLRPEPRGFRGREIHAVTGLEKETPPPVIEADAFLDGSQGCIGWYHRNTRSIWQRNLEAQGLQDWAEQGADPLLGRMFGGMVAVAPQPANVGPLPPNGIGVPLQSAGITPDAAGIELPPCRAIHSASAKQVHACVAVHTQPPGGSVEDWEAAAAGLLWQGLGISTEENAAEALHEPTLPAERAAASLGRTRRWWKNFWEESTFFCTGSPEADALCRGYHYQKFLLAAAGRGRFPIKFNGSLFTADWEFEEEPFGPDYRRWGGGYWFQNTRLIYWALLPLGCPEMLEPFFRMYADSIPLACFRNRTHFGHPGMTILETQHFWGTYLNNNYGYEREGLAPGVPENRYIRYYFQGGLELVMLGLDCWRFYPEHGFLDKWVLPLAVEILAYYTHHYPRTVSGRLRIYPASALETYQDALNPLPEIAGLQAVLDRLLRWELAPDPETAAAWRELREALPPIPGNEQTLLPAGEVYEEAKNMENPELYSIFPYRIHRVGRPDFDRALHAYEHRAFKRELGWHQDPVQAAMLGLAEEAFQGALRCLGTPYEKARFPGFWGPNYDWIPDQDQGSVGMMTVHHMLMQYDDDEVRLFPAWPDGLPCRFRLRGPGGEVVEGAREAAKG